TIDTRARMTRTATVLMRGGGQDASGEPDGAGRSVFVAGRRGRQLVRFAHSNSRPLLPAGSSSDASATPRPARRKHPDHHRAGWPSSRERLRTCEWHTGPSLCLGSGSVRGRSCAVISTSDFKRGLRIQIDGDPYVILDVHVQSPSARGASSLSKIKV